MKTSAGGEEAAAMVNEDHKDSIKSSRLTQSDLAEAWYRCTVELGGRVDTRVLRVHSSRCSHFHLPLRVQTNCAVMSSTAGCFASCHHERQSGDGPLRASIAYTVWKSKEMDPRCSGAGYLCDT